MVGTLLLILIILWLIGNIGGLRFIPGIALFYINGHPVSIINIITFVIVAWLIRILPTPLRQITAVMLILWVLSLMGIIAVSGLSNIVVLIVIIGLFFYLFGIK